MNQIDFIEKPAHSLSPFSAHRIDIWGQSFPTVEHAYHYARFVDCPRREEIKNAPSPIAAWQMSQELKGQENLLDSTFNKDQVMEELFRVKLQQHTDVKEVLVSTGDSELLKVFDTDYYWGTGKDGTGENKMGKLWMQLRSEL